jgi:SAM-dependent methyltransferase
VPVLLNTESKRLVKENLTSSTGKGMSDEYLANPSISKKWINRLFAIPDYQYRVNNPEEFIDTVTYNDNPEKIILSVGGGPKRVRGNCINLNIGLYPNVDIVADAHHIPIKSQSVDGVLILAVLEHVEDPRRVVDESLRILKKGGYIYAETPFLQHYHGYPRHFQNFTLTGHTCLFSKFKKISEGPLVGPFSTLGTLIKDVPEDLIQNKYIRKLMLYLFGLILIPIQLLDILIHDNPNVYKFTSGVYFLGKK